MEIFELLILVAAMAVVGVLMGFLAGKIWQDERPYGLGGDIGIAIICTVLIGVIGWYVIPAMGFSDTIKYISVIFEPALGALLVLWLIRRAKR